MTGSARTAIAACGGLVGTAGLAVAWGISRQQVLTYSQEDDFPAPVPVGGSDVLVWLLDEANAWKANRRDMRGYR